MKIANCLIILCVAFLAACKDSSLDSKENSNKQVESKLESSSVTNVKNYLDSIRSSKEANITYNIYEIEKEKAFLYITQNDKGILSAAFKGDKNSLNCSIKNMEKSVEIGVKNGLIDCKKIFTAKIKDGVILDSSLAKNNISNLLESTKQLSDIASVSQMKVNLNLIKTFEVKKQIAQNISNNGNQAVRFDFLCSNDKKIHSILNKVQTKFFNMYKITPPKDCQSAQIAFNEFSKKSLDFMKKSNGESNKEIQYIDFNINFFNESYIGIEQFNFTDIGGAHGNWNIKSFLYSYTDKTIKEVDLYSMFFNKDNEENLMKILTLKHDEYNKDLNTCKFEDGNLFYDKAQVSLNYDGIDFIYSPYEIAPYSCGEIRLKLNFNEASNFLKQDQQLFKKLNSYNKSNMQENSDTLYLECEGKCIIETRLTQDEIIKIRKKLDDESFYKRMSFKELDSSYLEENGIKIHKEIYNDDYKAIVFNDKYKLDLTQLQDAQYILYEEGKTPYCVVNKQNDIEINAYFKLKNEVEIKNLNKVESININKYLMQNNIDLNNNYCYNKTTKLDSKLKDKNE